MPALKVYDGTTWQYLNGGTAPPIRLGYAQVVANQASITTTTDLTGLTATVNVAAGRTIRVTAHIRAAGTNNDNIASPAISTTMKWTLNDKATLTGFVSGGGVSTVTFDLYSGADCEGSVIFTETVNVNDGTGIAATTTGYTTETSGTYRWIASFSGNSFNAPIASDCDDEVTTLP